MKHTISPFYNILHTHIHCKYIHVRLVRSLVACIYLIMVLPLHALQDASTAGGEKALRGHHFLPWSRWIHRSWWWATTSHHVGAARRVLAKRTPEAPVEL